MDDDWEVTSYFLRGKLSSKDCSSSIVADTDVVLTSGAKYGEAGDGVIPVRRARNSGMSRM